MNIEVICSVFIVGLCAGFFINRVVTMIFAKKTGTPKFDGIMVLDARNNEFDESAILLDIDTKEELYKRDYIVLKVNVRG